MSGERGAWDSTAPSQAVQGWGRTKDKNDNAYNKTTDNHDVSYDNALQTTHQQQQGQHG